jgi:hypothetical protein
MLSTRLLHYGESEMSFFCWEDSKCECGEEMHINESLELNFGEVEPSRMIGSADPVMNWSAIVRAYSCRKSTFQSDKLPALSGLVSAFQRRQG